GTVLTSSAVGNRYTYTGREWDETLGLHHFRSRWMSPMAGRFLGRDPMGFVDGSNVYSYTRNQSLLKIDPYGFAGCTVNWTGPCTISNYRLWVTMEIAELNTWLPKLKPCPCDLSCFILPLKIGICPFYFTYRNRIDYPICPDRAPSGFTDLGFWANTGNYHPGTIYELRENNCPDTCTPGNQCTYDANGKLWTTSPAAGSADRFSGGCGVIWNSNHRQGDVYPHDCATKLDPSGALGLLALYDQVRPLNGGKPCTPGPRLWQ
ncbi:MAG: RHS repeat-associated core domain-containing protein, partial [Pirellula sp.]